MIDQHFPLEFLLCPTSQAVLYVRRHEDKGVKENQKIKIKKSENKQTFVDLKAQRKWCELVHAHFDITRVFFFFH